MQSQNTNQTADRYAIPQTAVRDQNSEKSPGTANMSSIELGAGTTPLPSRHANMLCLEDFQHAARRRLPKPIFEYISGGVENNRSLQSNLGSFERYDFVPRTLIDISKRSLSTPLLGRRYSAPFGIAPVGLSALSAYRGDIMLALAAAREGVPMIMSASSLIRLEEVAQANPEAWFQAYLPGDDANIVALLKRIADAGFKTLVITVDTPVAANRENNVRTGFSTPLRPSLQLAWQGITHPRWLFGTFLRTLVQHGMPHFENSYATRSVPILSSSVERDFSDRGHLNWRHFSLIRDIWTGQLIIKGILSPKDACIARDAGADGIIVSNHGGRQLDSTVPPLRMLSAIVSACPEIPVMLDSGVRRGGDVIKALALGARFVFVGRPFAFAAAAGGEAGVLRAIELLKTEVSRNMAMLGVTRVEEIDSSYLIRNDSCGTGL
jgi:L-lactate dehydrogenase (cytochrome)